MKPNALFLTLFAFLTYFITMWQLQAVVPAPDGGYPGGNTAEGQNALFSLTSGGYNTAAGFFSLRNDTTGSFNAGFGAGALLNNNADQNCAFGVLALFSNTGPGNSAFGFSALASNTANANAAFGAYSLSSNTTGNFNTASGFGALQNNTTGAQNTAVGSGALLLNTTSSFNTAIGVNALLNNTADSPNSAFGYAALQANTTGSYNTAIGTGALSNNTAGAHNIAIGDQAGQNVTGDNNILIGNVGDAADNSKIRIGNSSHRIYIDAIGAATFSGTPVVWDPNTSVLGQSPSSGRFKKDIQPLDKASEAIFALEPVSFHYKDDPKSTPCFGLVAEDVVEVNPDLVVRDKEGKPYTVRYDAVNAMLLNEFLKEHKAFVEAQHKVEKLEKQIEALTAGLQKVRAQLELNKPAPRTVKNTD